MWPKIRFDPIKLFDLQISDLLLHDTYFVKLMLYGDTNGKTILDELGSDFFIGLQNAPDVLSYFCEVCPEKENDLRIAAKNTEIESAEKIKIAEERVLRYLQWNLGMTKNPAIWDALPWSAWDPKEIYKHVEIKGKKIIDIGAGTGQVSLRCAPYADFVYALEPVARLRRYIDRKLSAAGFKNFQTLNGVLQSIPLKENSIDIGIISSGSFGWYPNEELKEIERVIRPHGTMLMLAVCSWKNKETINLLRKNGYEEIEFALPTEEPSPSFIKEFI
jgi:precorrin-6B methylase 2